MKHIVMYSGGIGSWATAKRVIEQHGKENVTLLFTDTLIEDEDLYRFIDESVPLLGCEYVRIADGRDPWEVFKDSKWIGNSRVAQCSHLLKQKVSGIWVKEHFTPDNCTLYIGIDWTETHRLEKVIENWKPYTILAPMTEEPYLDKEQMLQMLERDGIKRPRLYTMGMTHNNCGGFCVRAGQAHFANLLKQMPERYAYHEAKEQEMRDFLGRDDVSILTRTKNGEKTAYTLSQLREDIENRPEQIDMFDFGGCGCFSIT